jgi:hypothetical protein
MSNKSYVNNAFEMLHYALTKIGASGKVSTTRTKVSYNDLLRLANKPEDPENEDLYVLVTIDTEWSDDSALTNSIQKEAKNG